MLRSDLDWFKFFTQMQLQNMIILQEGVLFFFSLFFNSIY